MRGAHKVFTMVLGKTMDSHKQFMDRLTSNMKLHEVFSENDSDVIIAFVPIVSRAGTDIQAALQRILKNSNRNIILVSLHHTFDPYYIAPDSRHSVRRSDVFAVDCLYHEEQGLLNCQSNNEALKRVIKHLEGEKPSSEPSWGVDNMEPIFQIITVLSILLVYLLLPVGYSFLMFLIIEIFVLGIVGIMAVSLNYHILSKWTLGVFSSLNLLIMLIIKFNTQTPMTDRQDLQEPLFNHE